MLIRIFDQVFQDKSWRVWRNKALRELGGGGGEIGIITLPLLRVEILPFMIATRLFADGSELHPFGWFLGFYTKFYRVGQLAQGSNFKLTLCMSRLNNFKPKKVDPDIRGYCLGHLFYDGCDLSDIFVF